MSCNEAAAGRSGGAVDLMRMATAPSSSGLKVILETGWDFLQGRNARRLPVNRCEVGWILPLERHFILQRFKLLLFFLFLRGNDFFECILNEYLVMKDQQYLKFLSIFYLIC